MPLLGRFALLAFLAALLGYGALFAYTMLANFDVVNLHRDAYVDDAFYYFEIARNLAAGKFSTFDGGITRTNGYHPVWLLMVTPFYWFLDLESALFGIKALEIMLLAGGVCLLALAVRLAQLPWILLFAVLPALYIQQGMLLGMEAAAGAFFLGATLLAAVLFAHDPRRWRWPLAGIAFLLPWVRLEYVAIALFVTGSLALLAGTASYPPRRRPMSCLWQSTAWLPFVSAVVGILGYLLYNGVVFGGVLPVSGVAKTDLFGITLGAIDWPRVGIRFVRAAGRDALAVAELCGYALLIWGVARLRGWSSEAVGLLAVLATVLAFGVENLAVKAQTALFYSAHVAGYSTWYHVPGYLAAALMVPLRCYVVIFLLRRFVPGRLAVWRSVAAISVCAAGVALALDPYGFTEPFRFVHEGRHSHYLKPPGGHWNGGLAREVVAFEGMLPDDAILGSWDAGAIGYFAERPVVNLDGVVNSYDYLRADPDKWGLWLRREGVPALGVTHLANSVRGADETGVGRFEYVGSRRVGPYSLKLWSHGAGVVPSKPWRRATSPSFGADGKRSGYRVIRHGRLMQVFVSDCVVGVPATNVPEMLAFAWREGAEIRSEQRLWVRPHRTPLGYCTMTFLLPHGAATAAEIFVNGTTVDRVVAETAPLWRARSAHAAFAVYAVSGRLLYIREPRDAAEAGDARTACLGRKAHRLREDSYYFLHVYPAARRNLRHGRLAYGFVDDGGMLAWMRRRVGERCVAEVEMPAVRIRELVTGEIVQGKRSWQARIDGLALQPRP